MKSLRNLSAIMSTVTITLFFVASFFGHVSIAYVDREFFATLMALGIMATGFTSFAEFFPDDPDKMTVVRKIAAFMFAMSLLLVIGYCLGENIKINVFGLLMLMTFSIAAGTSIAAEISTVVVSIRAKRIVKATY